MTVYDGYKDAPLHVHNEKAVHGCLTQSGLEEKYATEGDINKPYNCIQY